MRRLSDDLKEIIERINSSSRQNETNSDPVNGKLWDKLRQIREHTLYIHVYLEGVGSAWHKWIASVLY